MMLGIGAIQRVKESARGDGKGYFSIATQRRTAGCGGNVNHPEQTLKPPPQGQCWGQLLGMGRDPSGLTYAAIAAVRGSFLDGVNGNISLLPLPPSLRL